VQGAQFVAANRCVAGVPFLTLRGALKVDLVLAKVYQLACPQAVAISHKNHSRVPVAVTVVSAVANPVRLCAEVSEVIVVAAKAFETIAMAPAIALT